MERSTISGFSIWGRPTHTSRCMLGQITHECFLRGLLDNYVNDQTYQHATDAIRVVIRRVNARALKAEQVADSIASYNDRRSHAQVMRLLRVAVANLDRGGYQQRAIERKTRQIMINATKGDDHGNELLGTEDANHKSLESV
jgi:hypothetical protein